VRYNDPKYHHGQVHGRNVAYNLEAEHSGILGAMLRVLSPTVPRMLVTEPFSKMAMEKYLPRFQLSHFLGLDWQLVLLKGVSFYEISD
jgi:hypothetical protein